MEPDDDEVVFDAPDHFCIYKSGRIDRFHQPVLVAAGVDDDASGVASKDVIIDAGTGLSVRLFLPKRQEPSSSKKLPVVVYFHGGGFILESAKSATYHNYLASLAAAAGVLAVSVDYRLAPEHRLPAAYDDCWAALRWATSARDDDWLAEHGDTSRVFVAGDSAGGNIVHNVLTMASSADNAPRIEGAVMLHPFFGGSTAIEGEPERAVAITAKVWAFACPDAAGGADDPRINPMAPGAVVGLAHLGCERLLVCAAAKDWLAARGRAYYDAVAASAWPGSAAWLETEGEEHVFFLLKPECDRARTLMDRVVAFIAGE
jgi:acetyl esterase/lipase